MLQWFIRFAEFTEFLIQLGKTPMLRTITKQTAASEINNLATAIEQWQI